MAQDKTPDMSPDLSSDSRNAGTRRILGPFNRVEGDIELRLDIQDEQIAAAHVVAPLYRGFEQLLVGRKPEDALVIAPRICGICSLSQSLAAARALAAWAGMDMPAGGRQVARLASACENALDHLTHFYLFFMADPARPAYADRPWHEEAQYRFQAKTGDSLGQALQARADFLQIPGILTGKWPHSLAIQPGGMTKSVDTGEKSRLLARLSSFRRFLERQLYGAPLEDIASLDSLQALEELAGRQRAKGRVSDLALFLQIARDLGFGQLGRLSLPMISAGGAMASPEEDEIFRPGLAWPRFASSGLNSTGLASPGLEITPGLPDPARIVEGPGAGWFLGEEDNPASTETLPDADLPDRYSWCRAPRLRAPDGLDAPPRPAETGAIARQLLDGQPLIRALVASEGGSTVQSRVLARLIELARLIPAMEAIARALDPAEPFCNRDPGPWPENGSGIGMVEAARGTLGHWLSVREGRIERYQIIAPTSWNFSPRDARGAPGPLEQALEGLPCPSTGPHPLSIQHVIRSFDPCMVCTAH